MLSQFIPAVAAAVAVTAAVSDFKERRIPNRLTYPAMVVGLVLQTALHGWAGLLFGLGGGLFWGGVFFVFYLVRGLGAGDVKLATALGCIIGNASPQVMLATALAGGVMAIVYIVLSGRLVQALRNTVSVVAFHARRGLRTHPVVNLDNPGTLRLPYGLAFAAGTVYWAIFANFWR
jgi:prepilin peptidase CpaA